MAEEAPRPNAPIWIKVFVAFHLCAITIWALPQRNWEKNPPGGSLFDVSSHLLYANSRYLRDTAPVKTYLFTTGFWQYWDMFSPNPSQVDIWADAIVDYKDGSSRVFAYPRMFNLSIPHKYVSERYRKFYERVNRDEYAYIWAPFAQQIAHLMDNPQNPPKAVKLRRHWRAVAPPGTVQRQDYNEYVYYIHIVDQRELEQDRQGLWR